MSTYNSSEIIEHSFSAICEVFEALREQDYVINQKNEEITEKTNNLDILINQNNELKVTINQLNEELKHLKVELDKSINILSVDIDDFINNTQECSDELNKIYLFKENIINEIKNRKNDLKYTELLNIFTIISNLFPEFGEYREYIRELNLYCSDIMNYTLNKYLLVIRIKNLLPNWILEMNCIENILNKILYEDLEKIINLDLKVSSYDEFTKILGNLYEAKEYLKHIYFDIVEKIYEEFGKNSKEVRKKYIEYTSKIDNLVVGTVKYIGTDYVYVDLEEDVEGIISTENIYNYRNYIIEGVIAGYIQDSTIDNNKVLIKITRPNECLLKIGLLESMYVYGVDDIKVHCIEESKDTSYVIINGIKNKEKISYIKKYLEKVLLLDKELNLVNYSTNCVEYCIDLLKIDIKKVHVEEKENKIIIKGNKDDIEKIEYKLSNNKKVIEKLIGKELVVEKSNYKELYNLYLRKQGKEIEGKIIEVKSDLVFIDVGDHVKVTLKQEDCCKEINKYKKGEKIKGKVIVVSLEEDEVNIRISVDDEIEYTDIKSLDDIKNGDRIIHDKYGKGKIIKKVGLMMSVRFDKNTIKILNIEDVINEGSIKKM